MLSGASSYYAVQVDCTRANDGDALRDELSNGVLHRRVVFFFKQKTAYEI